MMHFRSFDLRFSLAEEKTLSLNVLFVVVAPSQIKLLESQDSCGTLFAHIYTTPHMR